LPFDGNANYIKLRYYKFVLYIKKFNYIVFLYIYIFRLKYIRFTCRNS